jgi:hypothetical protein
MICGVKYGADGWKMKSERSKWRGWVTSWHFAGVGNTFPLKRINIMNLLGIDYSLDFAAM